MDMLDYFLIGLGLLLALGSFNAISGLVQTLYSPWTTAQQQQREADDIYHAEIRELIRSTRAQAGLPPLED